MAGLLDSLFRGNASTMAPDDDQQGALLADLLKRIEAGQAMPGGVITSRDPAEVIAQTPPDFPLPPMQDVPIKDRPQVGVPYAPPAAPAAVQQPSPAPARQQAPAPREPGVWDRLGALARGYEKGGLVGGIADAMGGIDRAYADQNATASLLAKRLGDPEVASLIAKDPALVRAVIPNLFAPKDANLSVTEIYDEKGQPQKALFNPRNGQIVPIGGVKLEKVSPPQGHEWIDPADRSKGVRRIPGFESTIPGDVAGKVAMMNMARQRILNTRGTFERDWGVGDFARWTAANVPGVGDLPFLSGDVGVAQRDIQTGIEAALRTMTGAAAPEQEVVRYARMFMPGPQDTQQTVKQKIDGLVKFMEDAEKLVTQGRGNVSLADATKMLNDAAAVGGGGSPAGGGSKPDKSTAVAEARKAIAAGKDPNAVRARLKAWGYDLD